MSSSISFRGCAALIFLLCLNSFAVAQYSGGSGTVGIPYQISNSTDLQTLMNTSGHWGSYFELTGNVDASGVGAPTSIGTSATPFTGSFDGKNFTISNVTISNPASNFIGLFGYTDGSTIKNLNLTSCNIIGRSYVGGLVGYNYNGSTVDNCSTSGQVTCEEEGVGGLCGNNRGGSITNSSSSATVAATNNVYTYNIKIAGGFVGWNSHNATIDNCHATGTVNITGSNGSKGSAGGFAGVNGAWFGNPHAGTGTITNSSATGDVSCEGEIAGGFVAFNYEGSYIENCFATGKVTADRFAGGFVGVMSYQNSNNASPGPAVGKVYRCYAFGDVETISQSYAGGFVGRNQDGSIIEQCFAKGNATAATNAAGGFAGGNTAATALIIDCYSTGNATAALDYVGSFIGYNSGKVSNSHASGEISAGAGAVDVGGFAGTHGGTSDFTNNYWNTDTTGTTNGIELGNAAGITGLTEAEYWQQSSFAGFNFATVWVQKNHPNLQFHSDLAFTTTAISNITTTTASSGGNITSDGGSTVTARGVCWSTNPLPTTSDSKTTDGSGTGAFTSNLTGLVLGTTYYVRAYTTSGFGTSYGDQKTFSATPTYNIHVASATGGKTDKDGDNYIAQGGSLTITASSSANYTFLGWTGSVTGSDNPLTIASVAANMTLTPVFSQTGAVKVNISGSSNGKWRIPSVSSNWNASDDIRYGIVIGTYTVEFKPVTGFSTPANQSVTIEFGRTTSVLAKYVAKTPPTIHYFTATPETVAKGGASTLEWWVENAEKVTLGGKVVDATGSKNVTVTSDTVYTLAASNGRFNKTATTKVAIKPDLEINYFTSLHGITTLAKGGEATLCWSVDGANHVELKAVGNAKAITQVGSGVGEYSVSPDETTTYKLIATYGAEKKKLTLKITVDNTVKIDKFEASPQMVYAGNSSTLTWETRNADDVEINQGISDVAKKGKEDVVPIDDITYTLKATNDEGSLEAQTSVAVVNSAPDLEVQLVNATPSSVLRVKVGAVNTVPILVTNVGTSNAKNIQVALTDNGRLASQANINVIRSGKQTTVNLRWVAQTKGPHKLKVTVDPENIIGEMVEENNEVKFKSRATEIVGKDLVIDDISIVQGTTEALKNTWTISYRVHNVGKADVSAFQYQVYIAAKPSDALSKAIAVVNDDHINSLSAGKSVLVRKVVRLDRVMKRFYLVGKVDVRAAIKETNELNNRRRIKIKPRG